MKKLFLLLLALMLVLTGCSAKKATDTTQTAQPTATKAPAKVPDEPEEFTDITSETEGSADSSVELGETAETPAATTEPEGEIDPMKAIVTMKTVTVDKTDAAKPVVTIEMASGGIIRAELYPDIAPITVENFITLIEKGFYNGLTFHRNIPEFVIQGGCPLGNGTGGPGYTIKGEFTSNGVKNDLSHVRGVLSMARAADPNSAGSQFFIMHADSLYLDGDYAAFGKVIEGMDVVDSIATSGM